MLVTFRSACSEALQNDVGVTLSCRNGHLSHTSTMATCSESVSGRRNTSAANFLCPLFLLFDRWWRLLGEVVMHDPAFLPSFYFRMGPFHTILSILGFACATYRHVVSPSSSPLRGAGRDSGRFLEALR
jgi:hypothetical protein